MSKPYLFIMTGIAGAGKSHVAQMIASETGAIWISSDGVRSTMFPENTHDHKNMTAEKNSTVFNLMDYFSIQAFQSGVNVVYDAANNTETVRKKVRDFASINGAIPVAVLVDTEVSIARDRATTRQAGLHAWTMPVERHNYNVKMFEEVADKENLIIINGTISKDEQKKSLNLQMNALGQSK